MEDQNTFEIKNGAQLGVHFLDVPETSCPYPWTSMGIGYCVLRRAERNHRCFSKLTAKMCRSTDFHYLPL